MSLKCSTPADVSAAIAAASIEFVDIKFTDLYGQWQHFSVPVDYYDEGDLFESGLGFDGSSIRGFKSIESSDMLLVCDPTTAFIDPVCSHPTISLIANVFEPGTMERFSRDPRNVAIVTGDEPAQVGQPVIDAIEARLGRRAIRHGG